MPQNTNIPVTRLANVIPGAKALDDDSKGVNETFVGLIETDIGKIRAYIKVLDSKQLVNELICSTFGRAVGLPIPEGFIVRVRSEDLPESEMLSGYEGEALIFACADVGYPSLARRMKQDGDGYLVDLLKSWKHWDSTSIFDEWFANADRHQGNLLVQDAKTVWLIDHGHALTGPNWSVSDLNPNVQTKNQIADYMFPKLTLPERMIVRSKANAHANNYKLVDTDVALKSCKANDLLSVDDLSAVNKFISERVDNITDLVSSRLGIPNMGV